MIQLDSLEKTNRQLKIYAAGAFATLVLFVLTYLPVWQSLITTWARSEDYSHAFLILPISIYLVWSKKNEFRPQDISVSSVGCALVVFSCILYVLGYMAGIATLTSFSMVLCLTSIVVALTGIRVSRKMVFPLLFLFLMIPIPSQIYFAATTPLQLLVSKASVLVAFLANIPIYREGNVLHLPERTLQVVAACSGMRSLIALVTLSLIFGYITLRSNIFRTLLVLLAFPVAIFINVIRVTVMVLGFHYFDYDFTQGSPHTYLGVSVFLLALALMVMAQKVFTGFEK